jgi:hypothetical protein
MEQPRFAELPVPVDALGKLPHCERVGDDVRLLVKEESENVVELFSWPRFTYHSLGAAPGLTGATEGLSGRPTTNRRVRVFRQKNVLALMPCCMRFLEI